MSLRYNFTASVWIHSSTSPGSWYFVSLPIHLSKEIRSCLKNEEEGWGRLKVWAKINNSEWHTAIWFDTKKNTYLLPIKAEIRRKEKINLEDKLEVEILI